MMSKAMKHPKLQTKFVAKKKVPKGRQMEVEPTEQKKHQQHAPNPVALMARAQEPKSRVPVKNVPEEQIISCGGGSGARNHSSSSDVAEHKII